MDRKNERVTARAHNERPYLHDMQIAFRVPITVIDLHFSFIKKEKLW